MIRYFFYRKFMEFMHRRDWHYAPRIGPLEDGSTMLWCKWCGFRESYGPLRGIRTASGLEALRSEAEKRIATSMAGEESQ